MYNFCTYAIPLTRSKLFCAFGVAMYLKKTLSSLRRDDTKEKLQCNRHQNAHHPGKEITSSLIDICSAPLQIPDPVWLH